MVFDTAVVTGKIKDIKTSVDNRLEARAKNRAVAKLIKSGTRYNKAANNVWIQTGLMVPEKATDVDISNL